MTLTPIVRRLLVVVTLLQGSLPAMAGPPLSIDDPGILDPGQFEFIAAVTMTSADGGEFYELPLLDISYGLVEDYVQVSAGLYHGYVTPDGGQSERNIGNLAVGAKFRFLNSAQLQIAFAPGFVLGVSDRIAENGVGESDNVAIYPIVAEYQINDKWRLNAEWVYAHSDGDENAWGYGFAVAHTRDDHWELLFEVSGVGDRLMGNDFMQARVGFDHSLTESLSLLFSIGTGLRELSAEESVDFDVFLGFKLLR